MPEKFENTAFFLRLGLPSTLIRNENGAFANGGICKRRLSFFRVDRKHCEIRAFRKRWRHDNHMISLTEFLSSSSLVWTENI